MAELELIRSRGDRRLFHLGDLGSLHLHGMFGNAATGESGDHVWEFERRGILRRVTRATDESGAEVGEFRAHPWRRGGNLEWEGHLLGVKPASHWRERYALSDGDHELALLHARGWGSRPLTITLDDPGALPPGLLLFAAYAARSLAEDSSAGAGAATTAATAGS